ncbi:hypothetical protein [Kitasatospora sp. NPDC094011]|uniref:hypothetical protein n=1 Tax=Kitasatospora sp. NPDC094011 TaxID=3364090 RepID=UPI0037FE9E4E
MEIERSATDSRYAISDLNAKANSSGRGVASFKTYAGNGYTTDLTCEAGSTRVVRIIGMFDIDNGPDAVESVDFTAARS